MRHDKEVIAACVIVVMFVFVALCVLMGRGV